MPSFAIRRPRLEQLLDDHPERQVILVRGPAGAGKTVLVAQWIRGGGQPCGWLSIEPNHNDPSHLQRHLRSLVDLGDRELGTSITLVIDGIDRLRHDAPLAVVRKLVEQPPEAARIVLISRGKPQVGLERARLRDDLLEIPPAALRFDRAEIDALTATWVERQPSTTELEQATLGWAAGLRLMQLQGGADGSSIDTVLEPGGIASAYIQEELMGADLEDWRSLLDVTCWLPVLTEALHAAVLSQQCGRRAATWSDLEALPIQPVASDPGSFRLPPIVADALQKECDRRDPRAAASGRRRAADACWRAGELLTAIELFLDAGSSDQAALVCSELAEQGEASLAAVDELLHRRPEPGPVGSRWLPWRVRAAVAAGHVDEGDRLLGDSPTDAETAEPKDLVLARAFLAERLGDAATLRDSADRVLGDTHGADDDPTARIRAHGWRLRALAWMGEMEAARLEARAIEHPIEPGSPGAADLATSGAWLAWWEGEIDRASERLTAVLDGSSESAALDPELALLAGAVRRERGQMTKAIPLLERAHTHSVASLHRVVRALAASELARCRLAAGATMDALELVVSARAEHRDLPIAVDAQLRGTEVRVRLAQGDVGGAHDALHDAAPGVATDLSAARIALHDTPDQVAELVSSIEVSTPREVVHGLLLLAQVPDNDAAAVSAVLQTAVSAGARVGLVRTFLDEGDDVCRHLQALALESSDPALGRLAAIACSELALSPTQGSTDLVEQLTPRELTVLRMMPLRLSNREMAAQMYVSVNTLKTHVRAIYRKLDVPHRSAAVRRAKALQLV